MTFENLTCLVNLFHSARSSRSPEGDNACSSEELEESRKLFLNLLDAIGKEKKVTRDDVQFLDPSTILESEAVTISAVSLDEWLRKRMRNVYVIDCIGLAISYQKYQQDKSWLK